MINLRVSKCGKLVQKEYKMRPNRMGKVIHWELCKKVKFDHTVKLANALTRICSGEWNTKFSGILRYKQTLDAGQKTRSNDN